MNSIVEKESYDYESGFSNFSDGFKFCYSEDGDICLSTDCSTWAKKLIHNLPLSDYIESEAFIPPKVLHFPEFGTKRKKKKRTQEEKTQEKTQERKESVGNYIERRCRVCGDFTGDEENICYYCISLGF